MLAATSTALSLLLLHQILLGRLDEEINRNLTQEVAEFRRLVSGNDPTTGEPFGRNVRRIFDVYFARNVPHEGEVVLSAVGGRLYKSARTGEEEYLPGEVLRAVALDTPLDRSGSGTIETSSGTARYLSVPVLAGGQAAATFAVVNFPEHERREVVDAIAVAAQVWGVVLLLALGLAWAGAGRVLAPLRLLRDTAQSITETNLRGRISVRGTDEVAQLAQTFNQMLDRVEAGVGAQRRFLDDASHELKTPITIVRGHLELLSDDPHDRRETVALVTDELDRMSRIVNDLLVLARAEQPDFVKLETVDVAALTHDLHAKVSALDEREWRLTNTGSGTILADRQRLTQAFVQLAENAVKHTFAGDVIGIGTLVADGAAHLWVRDAGSGIPIEEQEAIFDRFGRGSGGRRLEGAGLGLSIVQAIARAHGGRVELDSRVGQGATFTLVLPVGGPRGASQ
ncbi:MAG: HAMP domain-containing histidine kinase [Actinomycetota bacterium]|nr:HAMP domain-containing histidine kinase [Actinomycetota bacterium]